MKIPIVMPTYSTGCDLQPPRGGHLSLRLIPCWSELSVSNQVSVWVFHTLRLQNIPQCMRRRNELSNVWVINNPDWWSSVHHIKVFEAKMIHGNVLLFDFCMICMYCSMKNLVVPLWSLYKMMCGVKLSSISQKMGCDIIRKAEWCRTPEWK